MMNLILLLHVLSDEKRHWHRSHFHEHIVVVVVDLGTVVSRQLPLVVLRLLLRLRPTFRSASDRYDRPAVGCHKAGYRLSLVYLAGELGMRDYYYCFFLVFL